MAHDAYVAAVDTIAELAFAEFNLGNVTDIILERLASESNVEVFHCANKLTRLINQQKLSFEKANVTDYDKTLFDELAWYMGDIPISEVISFIAASDRYENSEYYTPLADCRNMFDAGIEYAKKLAKETQNA